MVKARYKASIDELEGIIDLVNSILTKDGWTQEGLPVMDIAVEEIFVNIASYAYNDIKDVEPFADITINSEEDGVEIIFEDCGVPYNPLDKPDPDVTLSVDERGIGGLGIFMVKNSMDKVKYDYIDGRNVFSIYKKKE